MLNVPVKRICSLMLLRVKNLTLSPTCHSLSPPLLTCDCQIRSGLGTGLRMGVEMSQEDSRGRLYKNTERRKWNQVSPVSAVSPLQSPTEEQAASAEWVLRLSTSGQACHSTRRGPEGERKAARLPACPERGSMQLLESLTPYKSTPTLSLPPPASHSAETEASQRLRSGRIASTPGSIRDRKTACLFMPFNIDVVFPLHLSGKALHSLLATLSSCTQSLECDKGIHNLSSLLVKAFVIHMNKCELRAFIWHF